MSFETKSFRERSKAARTSAAAHVSRISLTVRAFPLLLLVLSIPTIAYSSTISYVIEPFEDAINPEWYETVYQGQGHITLSLEHNDTAPVGGGTSSLRIDYNVVQVEEWGGFVDFGHYLYGQAPHNCQGARELSLWYKVLQPQSNESRVHFRIILMDDSDCSLIDGQTCREEIDFEDYYTFHHVLSEATEDWVEIKIQLRGDDDPQSPFYRTGWSGHVGNNMLDLDRIRGWRIAFSMDSFGDLGDSSSGSILIDHLSCIGGGELLGAAFHLTNTSYPRAEKEQFWTTNYHENVVAENRTVTSLSAEQGLTMKYTIANSKSITYQHEAPSRAYYNLSLARSVSLTYRVLQAATPGQVELRMGVLGEGSFLQHVFEENLLQVTGVAEDVTISFDNYGNATDALWQLVSTDINSTVSKSFDRARVAGFQFELVEVSNQELEETTTSGILQIDSLVAGRPEDSIGYLIGGDQDEGCGLEEGFTFAVDELNLGVTKHEYLGGVCCRTCRDDPSCLVALAENSNCYTASYLEASGTGLISNDYFDSLVRVYVDESASKRGDFCDVCECIESERLIDCRGRDLVLPPVTFTPSSTFPWKPRVIDLSENPRLVVLPSDSMGRISQSVEEVRLPSNLKYLSLEATQNLTRLNVIRFENENEQLPKANISGEEDNIFTRQSIGESLSTTNQISNVVVSSSDFYAQVCCSRGYNIPLSFPSEGLTFCDMRFDRPGVDAVYEEFIEYRLAERLTTLRKNSPFLSEAAESVESCAQVCAIWDGCKYFTYDARQKQSFHACHLLSNTGTPTSHCCSADDYADENRTQPGYVSGRVARTRYELDKAKVLKEIRSEQRDEHDGELRIVLNEKNKFEGSFQLSLGSMPTRGAVWVEASSALDDVDLVINPRRVVLYDNSTAAVVSLTLSTDYVHKLNISQTGIITLEIKSCDTAFTAADFLENAIYFEVIKPAGTSISPTRQTLPLAVLIPLGLVLLGLLIAFIVERRRKKSDSFWHIDPLELVFGDPPEIIGRGTFGLVLLAEYRGTSVAVKRVIPPRMGKNHLDEFQANLFGYSSSKHCQDFPQLCEEDVDGGMKEHVPSDDVESGRVVSRWSGQTRSNSSSKVRFTYKSWPKTLPVKFFKKPFPSDEYDKLRQDFIAEMRQLSTLRHPCITTVMGAVIGQYVEPMLVMEYMDHGSLYDLLHNETLPLDGENILPILRDIAQGLRFLHAANPNVIHGDLKAQNILVDSRFRAKVADFGLSQKRSLGATGTPLWMAPELLRGESENTPASDVYSFGIILYEVYSRRHPYEGDTHTIDELVSLVCDPLVNLRPTLPSTCPPDIQILMAQCVDANPRERPSFEEIDRKLREFDADRVDPSRGTLHSTQSKQHTERLLYDVFPRHIADALRQGKKVEPESRDVVTIFFSDIVGFTQISSGLSPLKVSHLLDRLYHRFDVLSQSHSVFKVETIGDSYMAVTNLVQSQPDHAKRIAEFAIDALKAANETLIDEDDPGRGEVHIRIGFHSGPVVANVVGSRNPRYCVFGDTVNTASRMESNSEVDRIHCSEIAAYHLRQQAPEIKLHCRGIIPVKGKGEMRTFWVNEEDPCRDGENVDMLLQHLHNRRLITAGRGPSTKTALQFIVQGLHGRKVVSSHDGDGTSKHGPFQSWERAEHSI